MNASNSSMNQALPWHQKQTKILQGKKTMNQYPSWTQVKTFFLVSYMTENIYVNVIHPYVERILYHDQMEFILSMFRMIYT